LIGYDVHDIAAGSSDMFLGAGTIAQFRKDFRLVCNEIYRTICFDAPLFAWRHGSLESVNMNYRNASPPLKLTEGERWFVARALPHRESSAQLNLYRQGFRSFVPRVHRTVRHARTLRSVEAPLFPGYLFVVLNLGRDRWRAVNGTIGIAELIMGSEQPSPVPAGVVEALITTSDRSGFVCLDPCLEVGQKIRILAGPFADALGQLDQLDDRGRVRVLLDIMGGKVAVSLHRSSLAPVA
jgi:transcription antitermination factor NusG